MDEKEYLDSRLEEQIKWYSKKSLWNQNWYRRLKFFEVVISVTIPFLVGIIPSSPELMQKLIIGILGLVIAMIAGILNLYKFQENWIEYRTTAENLKHEKFMFLTKSGPYNLEAPFPIFVERTENLMNKENAGWAQYIQQSTNDVKTNG